MNSLTSGSSVKLETVVQRNHPQLPRYVVVNSRILNAWRLDGNTVVVEGTINGTDLGRRSLKRWDDQRWFIDLPTPLCNRAQIDTGSLITLVLRIASSDLPEELQLLLRNDPSAKAVWEDLTRSQKRMLCEHIRAAKQSATRERRAVRALKR